MRNAAIVIALFVVCASQAQRMPAPHILIDDNGQSIGRLSDVDGGNQLAPSIDASGKPTGAQFANLIDSFYPTNNDKLTAYVKGLFGSSKTATVPTFRIVSPRDPQSGLPTGRTATFFDASPQVLTLPAIDLRSGDDPGPITFEMSYASRDIVRSYSQVSAVKVRGWDPVRAVVIVGEAKPKMRATGPCTITVATGDVDGDGVAERILSLDSFSFTISSLDAGPWADMMKKMASAPGATLPMSYTIVNGNDPLITVTSPVTITSVDDDNWFPFDGLPGTTTVKVKNPFGKSKELTGHVTLIK
ncbi:MAG: hypothetical protein ABUL72_01925 [Armatimonadota bacterium]